MGRRPSKMRRIVSQACSVVRHLHAAGLLHMDLTDNNILVKWAQPGLTGGGASGGLYDIKIGDLGSVMPSDQRSRLCLDVQALERNGVRTSGQLRTRKRQP